MKNLEGLPERWAIDMKAEENHPRMREFINWHYANLCDTLSNWRYLGFNISDMDGCYKNVSDIPFKHITLITLDQFFEALEGKPKPITPTEGQLIEVYYNGMWLLRYCIYYSPEFNEVVVRLDEIEGIVVYGEHHWRFHEKVKVKQSDILAHYCKSLDLDPNNVEIV